MRNVRDDNLGFHSRRSGCDRRESAKSHRARRRNALRKADPKAKNRAREHGDEDEFSHSFADRWFHEWIPCINRGQPFHGGQSATRGVQRRNRGITMLFICANYLTMIITEFKEHPGISTAAGRPPRAATPTRNSKIRHSSRIDARRRPSSMLDLGSGLQKQGIGKVSGESQMEPCERLIYTLQCGLRPEALGA